MNLYDLKSKQEWQEILDDVQERLGMPAALLDENNVILQHSGSRNPLCLEVRERDASRSAICGSSQQFMANQAWTSGAPVVDVCEAGLVKIVLPLGGPDQPAGSLTACGSCRRPEDVELEMIQLNLPLSDDALSSLKEQVPAAPDPEVLKAYVEDLFRRVRPA